ncbi:wd repeat-containing protein [Anaeramoeba ignava]|uniref:Wd repeat-containing protein n=1 Tax=Anaeramoeba ignava TaxID=1746090 RepID=A0A9Q0RB84_ANAIG|nr:wd repeat-containing protein [Anaeramoeba ignava]
MIQKYQIETKKTKMKIKKAEITNQKKYQQKRDLEEEFSRIKNLNIDPDNIQFMKKQMENLMGVLTQYQKTHNTLLSLSRLTKENDSTENQIRELNTKKLLFEENINYFTSGAKKIQRELQTVLEETNRYQVEISKFQQNIAEIEKNEKELNQRFAQLSNEIENMKDLKKTTPKIDSLSVSWNQTKKIKDVHKHFISSLCLNHSGNIIATGDHDGRINLWDSQLAKLHKSIKFGKSYGIRSFDFTKNDNYLLSTTDQGSVSIVEMNQLKHIFYKSITNKSISDAKFIDDGTIFISGGMENNLILYNIENQKTTTLETSSPCISIAVRNQREFLSSHVDGKIKVWNLNTRKVIDEFPEQDSQILSISLSPDNLQLLITTQSSFKIFDVYNTTQPLAEFKPPSAEISPTRKNAVFSPCQNYVISSCQNTLFIWDILAKKNKTNLKTDKPAKFVAWDRENKNIVASIENSIKIWKHK